MTISGVLLAGGKSSRMGHDKATIMFRGQWLWKIQIELLRRLELNKIFVSARSDPPWRPANVEFVPDKQPSRGPLSGIAATFSRTKSDHLLTLAIDLPFITEAYLRSLCMRIGAGRGVIPMIKDRAEPLVAIYPRDAETEFASALSGNDFSLQPIARNLIARGKLQPIEVSTEEGAFFRNLNEPQDLDAASS
ncbi:MAG: molybdenum cofactor guanylyltransferase [Verrucomicrobia bacterium]|nr:molybdenum cofactor guanylyltransferase [Verrucomicrobiota bacterium]